MFYRRRGTNVQQACIKINITSYQKKMAKIENNTNRLPHNHWMNKSKGLKIPTWWGCRTSETLCAAGGVQNVIAMFGKQFQNITISNIHSMILLNNPILTYSLKRKTYVHKMTYTEMFIEGLFIIASNVEKWDC